LSGAPPGARPEFRLVAPEGDGRARRAPRLSKSRYLSGRQCRLRLWYECHRRDLATPPDEAQRARFEAGHEVGAVARRRYPGGRLVAAGPGQVDAAVAETARLLADRSVPAVYEAALLHRGVLVRVDVLARADGGGYDLVEVKSSTRLKDVHLPDVAVQAWVLRGAGVPLARAGVLTLDRDYVHAGGEPDVGRLFRFHDCSEAAAARAGEVEEEVRAFHETLAAGSAPEIAPGPHCFDPYECPYHAHCTRGMELPEHPLDELPSLGSARREALEAMGVTEVAGIPDGSDLSALQATVHACVREGREHVGPGLGPALRAVEPPLAYLDFETAAPAIPRYAGTRPYDAVPFQFSLHREDAAGGLAHHEYLHGDGSDPRRPLAEALLDAAGAHGSVCTYTGYEARVVRDLADALPDLRAGLEALAGRLWDLHAVIRAHYYHPQLHGSFSIKRVLPVLVGDPGYADLEIADGAMAALAWERMLAGADPAARARLAGALRAYCARDSLALARVRRALLERCR